MPKQYHYRKQSKPIGPTKAAINRSSTKDWLDVVTPYNQNFVSEIKATIDWSHRAWDPAQKVWHVHEMYLEELITLLKKYYDEVITDLTEESTGSDGGSNSNLFKQVFDVVPKDYADKVYFALSQACHPDHGGTNEMMSQLNKAYEEAK